MTQCPQCKKDNRDGVKICDYCGAPLIDVVEQAATRALGDTDFEENVPKWGSARYQQRITFNVMMDNGEEKSFEIDTTEIDQLAIGRVDPVSKEAPPIDLTDYNALDKGVSRRHANLIRKDGSLHIVDLGSGNGTFLNGQRLVADQPRVIRDGDDIRFGYLVIRVSFERDA